MLQVSNLRKRPEGDGLAASSPSVFPSGRAIRPPAATLSSRASVARTCGPLARHSLLPGVQQADLKAGWLWADDLLVWPSISMGGSYGGHSLPPPPSRRRPPLVGHHLSSMLGSGSCRGHGRSCRPYHCGCASCCRRSRPRRGGGCTCAAHCHCCRHGARRDVRSTRIGVGGLRRNEEAVRGEGRCMRGEGRRMQGEERQSSQRRMHTTSVERRRGEAEGTAQGQA